MSGKLTDTTYWPYLHDSRKQLPVLENPMNLVSLAMQFLAPALINKLAGSLGITSPIAQKALAAVVPAILAGLVGKSAQPGGAQILSDMLGKQDPGLLGNLANMIGGSQQKSIAEQGLGSLGALLGGPAVGALAGALGKFSGAGESATSGLLGMVAPALLGTIAQQQKSSGLDASGLASMLAGQKDNIAAALPGDFAKMLGGTGLIESIGPNLAKLAAPAVEVSRPTVFDPPAVKPAFNWMPWAAAAVALGLGWWWLAGRTPPQVALPTTPSIMVGNVNVADQFGGVMNNLRTSLGTVKDAASAQAALPRLREAQTELDRLGGVAGQLTGASKASLASYVGTWLPLITPLVTSAMGNSAAAPILKPVLDAIMSRVTAMSKS